MVLKKEVAYGIVKGLSEFWQCEELHDFTVTVDNTQFKCHRLLLAACSGFFRGLFRSGMKETVFKCVSIEDISSETFELILETMYTGGYVLTNDNVIDIWKAAHRLQIIFLITECEDFAAKTLSLENCFQYLKVSKLLNSDQLAETVWYFILKNAISFFKTTDFLELHFCDVLKLVKSQDLITNSEDDVIDAVLKWVKFTPRLKETQLVEFTNETDPDVNLSEKTDTPENVYFEDEGKVAQECDATQSLGEAMDTRDTIIDANTVGNEISCKDKKDVENQNAVRQKSFKETFHVKKLDGIVISIDNPDLEENQQKCVDEQNRDENLILQEGEFERNDKTNNGKGKKNITSDKEHNQTKLAKYKRTKHFPVLLSNIRSCLLSPHCLEMLSRHPLVTGTKVTSDIIVKSLLYQLQVGKRNGYWPPEAIYRENRNYEHTAVAARKIGSEFDIKAFSLITKEWSCIPKLYSDYSIHFVSLDKSLYAFGKGVSICPNIRNSEQHFSLVRLQDGYWSETNVTLTLPSDDIAVVGVDSFIYVLSPHGKEVWRLDPISATKVQLADLRDECGICFVMCYETLILAFYPINNRELCDIDYCDLSHNEWKKGTTFKGSDGGMVSFRDGQSTYILQPNGDLWKFIERQGRIFGFERVAKLWSCNWSPYGAVSFLETLFIYGAKSQELKKDPHLLHSLCGVFSKIIYMESEGSERSTFIPCLLSRKCLK